MIGVVGDLAQGFFDAAGAVIAWKDAIAAGDDPFTDFIETLTRSGPEQITAITKALDELALMSQEFLNQPVGNEPEDRLVNLAANVLGSGVHLAGQFGNEFRALIDEITASLNTDLASGVSPIRAVSDALLELQQRSEDLGGEFGIAEFAALTDGLNLTEEQLIQVVQRMQDLGAEISPVILEMLGLRNVTDSWMNLWQEGAGGTGTGLPSFEDFIDQEAIEADAKALEDFKSAFSDALGAIRDGFSGMGMTSDEFLDNIRLLNPEVAEFMRSMGSPNIARAKIETGLLNQAMQDLRIAMAKPASEALFGLGDVVDGIKLVTRTIESSGKEVLLHGADFSRQVIENLNQIAEFEANLTILFAEGFDDLARELASRGPEFGHIAEDFVADLDSASVLEAALESGGTISDELSAGVDDALLRADNDPALMEFVSQFGSQTVLDAVYDDGLNFGTRYGKGIVDGLRSQLFLLDELLGISFPSVPAFGLGPGSDLVNGELPGGNTTPPGVGTTGGGNAIQLNFSSSTPITEAARAGQIINALVAI